MRRCGRGWVGSSRGVVVGFARRLARHCASGRALPTRIDAVRDRSVSGAEGPEELLDRCGAVADLLVPVLAEAEESAVFLGLDRDARGAVAVGDHLADSVVHAEELVDADPASEAGVATLAAADVLVEEFVGPRIEVEREIRGLDGQLLAAVRAAVAR